MAKYELIEDDTTMIGHSVLHRIRALENFSDVKAGDLGGYIENEDNLSQEGNCWVYDFGKVHNVARVSENATVRANAQMHDRTQIYGNATLDADSMLFDDVQLYGNAEVRGTSRLSDTVQVYDNAKIKGNSEIHGDIQIYRDTILENVKIRYDFHRQKCINESEYIMHKS